jgi:hypothetical protein
MISGGIMGMCFAFMWVVSMYQMWFSRPPSQVIEREGGHIRIVE